MNEQCLDKAELARERKAAFEAGMKSGEANGEYSKKNLKDLQERVQAFEQASGVRIGDTWTWSCESPESIGKAVRLVLNGGHKETAREMERLREMAKHVLKVTDTLEQPEEELAVPCGNLRK